MHSRTSDTGLPATIEALVSQGDAAAAEELCEIAETADRDLAKAARTALYRLKLKGVAPAASALPPPAPQAVRDTRAVRAWVTTPSGQGRRFVAFPREDTAGGAAVLVMAMVSDVEGLVEIGGRTLGRRRLWERIEALDSVDSQRAAEVPVDYARHVVQEAVERTRAARSRVPDGFSEWFRYIGAPEESYPTHPVYALYDSEAILSDLTLSRSPETVFQLPALQMWLRNVDEVAPWIPKLAEAVDSPVVLDESQQTDRFNRALDSVADGMLTGDDAARYKSRLEDSAYVFHLLGEAETARQMLYHALSLDPGAAPHTQPFLRVLIERTISIMFALVDAEKERSRAAATARRRFGT